MSEQDNPEHRYQNLEKTWEGLSDEISRLHETRDHETRPDERHRLKSEIDRLESERTTIEAHWLSTELAWKKPELIRTAHQQERKHSYEEAIKTWRQVQALDPDDDSAAKAIRSLEPKIRQLQQLHAYQAQLAARFQDIASVFVEVMTRLNDIEKSGAAAMDNILIRLEAYGMREDLKALNAFFKELKEFQKNDACVVARNLSDEHPDKAIRQDEACADGVFARTEWTVQKLESIHP